MASNTDNLLAWKLLWMGTDASANLSSQQLEYSSLIVPLIIHHPREKREPTAGEQTTVLIMGRSHLAQGARHSTVPHKKYSTVRVQECDLYFVSVVNTNDWSLVPGRATVFDS